jgi:hypothetical protein
MVKAQLRQPGKGAGVVQVVDVLMDERREILGARVLNEPP